MIRKQAGFTLVELLIAISVTTIAMIVILTFAMRNVQTSTTELTQAVIQAEVQRTLDSVANDVRMSANADTNNRNPDQNSPGGSNEYGWASSSNVLVLASGAIDTADNVIFSDPANYVTVKDNHIYFVSDSTLYKRTLAANVSNNKSRTTCPIGKVTASCPQDKELLHNVSAFSVVYRDGSDASVTPTNARSIEISLTASKTQYTQTQSASYTTRMVFRND